MLTIEGRHPEEFRAAAKKELLQKYDVIGFENAEISAIEEIRDSRPTYFVATSVDGKMYRGRKIVLASGVRDEHPDLEGYGDCYGKTM